MKITRIDPQFLLHAQGQTHPAVARWRGRNWLAYRLEPRPWNHHTRVALTECDSRWGPLAGLNSLLSIPVPKNINGDRVLEDCRLFHFQDRLLFSVSDRFRIGLGELLPDRTVRDFGWLRPPHPATQEKNWQFFEHDGLLYGARWVTPLEIYQIEWPAFPRSDWRALLVHREEKSWDWPFGKPHGGTPPARFGNFYVSLFNAFVTSFTVAEWPGAVPHRTYSIAPYAFTNQPPFHTALIPVRPMLWSTPRHPADREPNGNETVFAVGLMREGDTWTCGFGDDLSCFLAEFSTSELFDHLKPYHP